MEPSFLRPKTIVTKILRVMTPFGFTEELLNYFKANVEQYLRRVASEDKQSFDVMSNKLRFESIKSKSQFAECPLIEETSNDDLIKSMTEYMLWMCKENKVEAHSIVNDVQAVVWGEAFKSKKIRVPFYSDVLPKLKEWNAKGINVFTVSHGSVNGQEAYFKYSKHDDISKNINGFIRIADKSYQTLFFKMDIKTDTAYKDILFITNNVKEAERARLYGLNICVVNRNLTEKRPEDKFYVNSFAQIIFTERNNTEITQNKKAL